MTQAKEQDTVRVHYTGKLGDGTVFDTSTERDPLEFTIGDETIVPGFEQAVVGMSPGERKTEEVPASMGFGPVRDELVMDIGRAQFPTDTELAVGERFQASRADGKGLQLTVVEIHDDTVVVDANHPLAGKDLVFEIELVEIVSKDA